MQQKVILLTGASSGIGYDTAVALAQQGHKVYAAARRVERMEPLRQYGITPLRMDVTDEQSMQQGVQSVLSCEGRIDVLINNAGYGYRAAIEEKLHRLRLHGRRQREAEAPVAIRDVEPVLVSAEGQPVRVRDGSASR